MIYFMLYHVLPMLLLLRTSKCSNVTDVEKQKGIYLTDYCPKSDYCEEGTHVMCMYYDPKRVHGPHCFEPVNVTVTPDLAVNFLNIANAIRSKLAFGHETVGAQKAILPRGYGIMRLRWDSELATFAQVLANTCLLRHDLCRATKRFPDPGQTAGIVRFTYPEWKKVNRESEITPPRLDNEKKMFASTETMKAWYSHKMGVDATKIFSYPDWLQHPDQTRGKHYLEMIYGEATHMGCGMSAYADYAYNENNQRLFFYLSFFMVSRHPDQTRGKHYLEMIYGEATHMGCGMSAYADYAFHETERRVFFYSVQVVCNFSARPKTGQPVYNTESPTEVGYTIRCGCPPGYEEDSDCLCSEAPVKEPDPEKPCEDLNCKPAVVLLPIFTVEDAPQHKLEQQISRRAESGSDSDYLHFSDLTVNTTAAYQDNNDIFNAYEIKETDLDNDIFKESTTVSAFPIIQDAQPMKFNMVKEKPLPRSPQISAHQASRINNRIHQVAAVPKSKRSALKITNYTSNGSPADPSGRMPDRKDRYPAVKIKMDVKNRYFTKPGVEDRIQSRRRVYDHVQRKALLPRKQSIFSRVSKFELPGMGRRDGTQPFQARMYNYKSDVAPRKDFSYSRKLLNNYLAKKRHHDDYSLNGLRILNYYESSTETGTLAIPIKVHNNFSFPQVNLNKYLVNKFNYPDLNISNEPFRRVDIKNANEETDKKLMALLDNLEQEVNHIDLNMNEKEIFDAKIRKIYGSVVGRNTDLVPSKRMNDRDDFRKTDTYSKLPVDVLEDLNNKINDNRIFETEDKIQELHSKIHPGLYSRPILRSQNSLEYDEKSRQSKDCLTNENSCKVQNSDNEELHRQYFEEKRYKTENENYMEQIKRLPFKDDIINVNDREISDMRKHNSYKSELEKEGLKDDRFIDESRKNIPYRNQNIDGNAPINRHVRYRTEFGIRNGYKKREDVSYRDPIGYNRRKQYQQKLDNLDRRLHDVRSYRRRNEHERERAMRLMRPGSRDEVPIRPSVIKSPVGPIYMPERARFLHGF